MTERLRDLHGCFEGEIPALFATCSAGGVPNLGHLSQVHLVDDNHVAVSNQFLTKSKANLAENPYATVIVLDPRSLTSHRLLLRHVRTESAGATFDGLHRSIEAIAAMSGMTDVFALKAVEVFHVLDVELVASRGTEADADA